MTTAEELRQSVHTGPFDTGSELRLRAATELEQLSAERDAFKNELIQSAKTFQESRNELSARVAELESQINDMRSEQQGNAFERF